MFSILSFLCFVYDNKIFRLFYIQVKRTTILFSAFIHFGIKGLNYMLYNKDSNPKRFPLFLFKQAEEIAH